MPLGLRVKSDHETLIRVACEPGSDVLEPVHRFLAEFTRLRLRPALAERLSLAGYELLANGLSYGTVSFDVSFELMRNKDTMSLVVENHAIPSRLRMLASHFEKLRANPEALYLEELRRSVSGAGTRAMLGLARVMHEAKMTLDITTEVDTRVIVTASLSL